MGLLPVDINASFGGDRFQVAASQEYGAHGGVDKAIGPAKTGALTTRTSDTVGTLTMDPGHGFVTADVIDLFWTVDGVYGARRGVVVGVVAGDSVPITGGTGDNLPAEESDITAMVPNVEVVTIDGDLAKFVIAKSSRPGFIVIRDDADAVVVAISIRQNEGAYIWYSDSGVDNPLATITVGSILTSHDDPDSEWSPKCIIGYD